MPNIQLSAGCSHPLHWRLTGTSQCLACMPAGFALDTLDTNPIVEAFTRIIETPRTPNDQARQLVQWLCLSYELKARP